MRYVTYVEIEHFKGFKDKIRINLDDPAVLIGPNNSGKTTVIQALSLWSRAVRSWIAKKGPDHLKAQRDAVGINRLNILDIPVKETKFFWNEVRMRKGNTPIPFAIEVGIVVSGAVKSLQMVFTYRDAESLYCKPSDRDMGNDELLLAAEKVSFNLLYPMSGIAAGASAQTEEPIYDEGRINVLLGEGQTALVLRNLCYKVKDHSSENWGRICELLYRAFSIKLDEPKYDRTRGALSLAYRQKGMDCMLDIALSGRGVQQMLLILAYLFSRPGGVLMIDEPDAHLEILRQRQIFVMLKGVATETRSQIVIATHSEVILDEAVDANLTGIVNGKAMEISSKGDVRATLRNLGIEHYYNAEVAKRILIVEGSTDADMLRSFAKLLNHKALSALEGRVFIHYAQDVEPYNETGSQIEKMMVAGLNFRQYFHILHQLVPDLKGIALFDGDAKGKKDQASQDGLEVFYWQRYELENYFITPETLRSFLLGYVTDREGDLFASGAMPDIQGVIDTALADLLFSGNIEQVKEYWELSSQLKQQLLNGKKMSAFAEDVFNRYAEKNQNAIPLTKGNFYKIISTLKPDEVPEEIRKKLDLIADRLAIDEEVES